MQIVGLSDMDTGCLTDREIPTASIRVIYTSDIVSRFRSSLRLDRDNPSLNGYTCQRGKARRASPVRRLAKRNGSPTLPERKYSQTRQTKCNLGVAMVDGLHSMGRSARAKTGVDNSRCGRQHE